MGSRKPSARDLMLANAAAAWQQQQQQQTQPPPQANQPPPTHDANGYSGLYSRRLYNNDAVLNYQDSSDHYYTTNAQQRDLAILSKGAGHMLPHAASQQHQTTTPVFDMSQDFPALGSAAASSGKTSAPPRTHVSPTPAQYGHVQQPGYAIRNNEVDFPALGATLETNRIQQQAAQTPQQPYAETKDDQKNPRNHFGLQGLLGVIRMTDADRNAIALGMDLTTLGLNLNSNEVLYPTFASPWAEGPSRREPDYILPYCYYRQPPALKTSHLSKFQLETLFYIFYNMPKDMLQVFAAKELYAREWKYHAELKLWFARPSDVAMAQLGYPAGTYVYFDTTTWERRVYPREHSESLQFMSDEEIQLM